jgi:hypothetical protein
MKTCLDLMLFTMTIDTSSSLGQALFDKSSDCSNKPISPRVVVLKATGTGLSAVDGQLLNLRFYQDQVKAYLFCDIQFCLLTRNFMFSLRIPPIA